ncbi:MAG: hypothetical protein ACJ72Z_02335 [Pyrinomonadaceae bacterium]
MYDGSVATCFSNVVGQGNPGAYVFERWCEHGSKRYPTAVVTATQLGEREPDAFMSINE